VTSTDIEERNAGQLAPLSDTEQKLVDAAKSGIDRSKLVLPALKLTHPLTAEVQDGAAESGHFINSLTGEDYGTEVEVVISALFDGRFYADGQGGSFAAQGDVAPDSWPDEYSGKAFVDIPDAEEQWKADTNEGVHGWEKGPPISTTHNFVGYVVGSGSELPVRISLMRSSNPAAFKLQTLIYAARAPWDRTFKLKVVQGVSNAGQKYNTVEVAQGEVTDPELRAAAVDLATSFQDATARGEVELAGDEAEGKKPKPAASKGLNVS
jgi:hypothetical protein